VRFGILKHVGFSKEGENHNRIISAGDVLECLAIRNIYRSMGIDEQDLVSCYPYELGSYLGEYCVLPINVYALSLDYSRRIIPCFLGLTMGGGYRFSEHDISLLRRFAPVGCRDERTMRILLDLGIDAYLQGCLVATFPRRERASGSEAPSKTFFVNPAKAIKPFIPKEILVDYEFVSHDYYTTPDELFGGDDCYEFGEELIAKYTREAKLVITSKYHSAVLCLALGIPVIMVLENNYYKYSWLEKFIPIYEPKDFPRINWNPKPVVIPDEEKELMLRIARRRIGEMHDKYSDLCKLSELRERPEASGFEDIFYGNGAIEFVKNNWHRDASIRYAFWGATDTSRKLNAYIAENFVNAQLVKVFDWSVRSEVDYSEGVFVPEPLDNITLPENENLFIFVAGNSASEAAVELFQKVQRNPDSYYLCRRYVLEKDDLDDES